MTYEPESLRGLWTQNQQGMVFSPDEWFSTEPGNDREFGTDSIRGIVVYVNLDLITDYQ